MVMVVVPQGGGGSGEAAGRVVEGYFLVIRNPYSYLQLNDLSIYGIVLCLPQTESSWNIEL